jgi:hypothetical protein
MGAIGCVEVEGFSTQEMYPAPKGRSRIADREKEGQREPCESFLPVYCEPVINAGMGRARAWRAPA